jgi:hypothetical protein
MENETGMVKVRSSGSIFFNGVEYKPKDGTDELTVPLEAVEHIESNRYPSEVPPSGVLDHGENIQRGGSPKQLSLERIEP